MKKNILLAILFSVFLNKITVAQSDGIRVGNKEEGPIIEATPTLKQDITKEPEIFDRAEIMPVFPGGASEMMKFISQNIIYPETALKDGLEGKVILRFYIDIDGTVKEPIVLKDNVGGGCAEEAVRLVKSMPKWSPATQRGKAVKAYYVLPITFKL